MSIVHNNYEVILKLRKSSNIFFASVWSPTPHHRLRFLFNRKWLFWKTFKLFPFLTGWEITLHHFTTVTIQKQTGVASQMRKFPSNTPLTRFDVYVPTTVRGLCWFHSWRPHLHAVQDFEKGEGHAAADDHLVHLIQHVVDQLDLIFHLRSETHRYTQISGDKNRCRKQTGDEKEKTERATIQEHFWPDFSYYYNVLWFMTRNLLISTEKTSKIFIKIHRRPMKTGKNPNPVIKNCNLQGKLYTESKN